MINNTLGNRLVGIQFLMTTGQTEIGVYITPRNRQKVLNSELDLGKANRLSLKYLKTLTFRILIKNRWFYKVTVTLLQPPSSSLSKKYI